MGTLAGADLLGLALDFAVWAALLMVVDYEEFAVLAVGYPEWLARIPRRGPKAHRATPAGVVAVLRMSEGPACQLELFLGGWIAEHGAEYVAKGP